MRSPTIRDVAATAGVSVSTASRAINGLPTVDAVLRKRVLETVEKLEYRPSHTARSLARGHTSLVGAVVPDLANPYFHRLLDSLSAAAAADGYRIVVGNTAEEASNELTLAQALLQQTDGVVLCGPRMRIDEMQELSSPPLVIVNRVSTEARIPSVSINDHEAALTLAAHFFQLGHRRLLYLRGPRNSWSNAQRERAFEDALGFGIEVHVEDCGSEMSDGYDVADSAVRVCRENGITGIVAHNDFVALGVLSRFRELDIDVPRELSLAGFDDIPFARYVDPPLTTMARPVDDLARLSWKCLRARLTDDPVPESPQLRCALVARSSTRPVQIEASTLAPVFNLSASDAPA